jgi:hypothetical protein
LFSESKKKVEKYKVETMGGVGGHPPKYAIIKVKYKKFGGWPQTPPIPSHVLPDLYYI